MLRRKQLRRNRKFLHKNEFLSISSPIALTKVSLLNQQNFFFSFWISSSVSNFIFCAEYFVHLAPSMWLILIRVTFSLFLDYHANEKKILTGKYLYLVFFNSSMYCICIWCILNRKLEQQCSCYIKFPRKKKKI